MASPAPASRRSFLIGGSALVAVAVAALTRRGSGPAINSAPPVPLPSVEAALPPLPADPAVGIRGLEPLITPTADFFRIDIARSIPTINAADWSLSVDGMVNTPVTLTYQDLLDMPLVELDATLACVSNPTGGYEIGTARWTGVPLADVLDMAGVDPAADQVMSRSESDDFSAGFPVGAVAPSGALIALGMNGEALSAKHGFPARLVVPGLYGYVSATKWLTGITLTRFDQAQGFWIPRGWSALGPVKTAARIDVPRQGASLPAGQTVIAGMAWSGATGISRVEVRVGDSEWVSADLGPRLAEHTWRQWWATLPLEAGLQRLTVRAFDGNGTMQTDEVAPVEPDGATGWHSSVVEVT